MDIQARRDITTRQLHVGGDPLVKDDCTILTAAASAATVIDTTSYAVSSQDGNYLDITIDALAAQRVTFSGAITTAAHVIAQINQQIIGGYATADGDQVRITSTTWGADSKVVVAVGTSDLTFGTASDDGTGGLKRGTVMTQNPATRVWQPHTDVTATDGTEMPRGVFEGPDIEPNVLAAGNVEDQSIAIGGAPVRYAADQLIFRNSVAITDEITNQNMTVESALANLGIYLEAVEFISQLENV